MPEYIHTGLKCPICSSELKLIEDVTYNEVDGELYKDVEHYFECVNGCDPDIINSMDNKDEHIERIVTERLEVFNER